MSRFGPDDNTEDKVPKTTQNSSNKKGQKTNTSSSASNASFDAAATQYKSLHYVGRAQTSVADEPKSNTVAAAEDAAALLTHFETCVDNFGSRVLAT